MPGLGTLFRLCLVHRSIRQSFRRSHFLIALFRLLINNWLIRLSSLFNKTTSKEPEDLVSEAAILEWVFFWIRWRQLKFFFARAARRIVSSQSVGKIMITILNFRVSTSKNKMMIINLKKLVLLGLYKFIYETNLISLLRGSTIQNLLNVCLFMYFIGI